MKLKKTEAIMAKIKAIDANDYDQIFNLLEEAYNAGYERGTQDALEDLFTKHLEDVKKNLKNTSFMKQSIHKKKLTICLTMN